MKRDASEVIAEMRARATFLRDRGDDFLNVEAEKMDDWANRLAAAEPADAGRDIEAEARRLFELNSAGWAVKAGWDELHPQTRELWHAHALKKLARPPSEAAAAVDDDGDGDADYEVWQDGVCVAGASGPNAEALREVMHYASQYEQDGPVELFRVIRRRIAKAALNSQQAVKP